MTSLACARLPDAVLHLCTTSGTRCSQNSDTRFSARSAGQSWVSRNPQLPCFPRSSFAGSKLLTPSRISEQGGSRRGLAVVATIKRGGGVRRKPKDVNPTDLASKGPKMNEAVLAYPNIRLLDQDQKMIGIVASADALLAAKNKELDLVLIAGDADPPVCRIMDYTKYKYEKGKKARDTLKRSKANRVDQKELKMRYNTDTGDYNTTLRKCLKFLRSGDKVNFSMNFKARETGFQKQGLTLFEKVQADVGEWGITEGRITIEGRNIFLMIGPNKPYIEKVRKEEAKAGKVVEEESDEEDDEDEEQGEAADAESDDDEEIVAEGGSESNGAAVHSESTTASVL